MTYFLFSDSNVKKAGGMEVHQENFLNYFSDALLVVKGTPITVYRRESEVMQFSTIDALAGWIKQSCSRDVILFFNNLSWIMDIPLLSEEIPHAKIVMRSGGNDIYKALAKMPDKTLDEKIGITAGVINNYTDKLIINSDYSYFRNLEAGILPEKMIKIRGGVSSDAVSENLKKREKERCLFDNIYGTHNKKLMVIASRFVPFKGITEFITQLVSFGRFSEWHLLIIGSGRIKDDVLSSLEQLPAENYTYLGEKSNVETLKYISISDLFINFSVEHREFVDNGSFIHTETMGRGMIEAISHNIPVLALDSGGTSELFNENTAIGFLLSDENETSECLERFIKDGYNVMCDTDYSWNKVFGEYVELFDSLLNSNSIPGTLVFDFDGTIKNDDTDLCALRSCMANRKQNKKYICLTARSRQDAQEIIEQLPIDYLVSGNGAEITSSDGKIFVWNHLSAIEQSKKMTELIYKKISGFVDCKITHPFTIHMVRPSERDVIEKISCVIGDMPYQIIASERFVKVQHKLFNKLGAFEYLMKDHCCGCVVGAGDGLNDAAFIQKCDIGYARRDLVTAMNGELSHLNIFEKDEVGLCLLDKMLDSAERKDKN